MTACWRGWQRSGRGERGPIVGGTDPRDERNSRRRPVGWGRIAPSRRAKTRPQHVCLDDARIEGDGRQTGRQLLGKRRAQSFDGKFGRAIRSDFR